MVLVTYCELSNIRNVIKMTTFGLKLLRIEGQKGKSTSNRLFPICPSMRRSFRLTANFDHAKAPVAEITDADWSKISHENAARLFSIEVA